MALAKSTNYAPDIYKALNGIMLVHKPARLTTKELIVELRSRISDSLNRFAPRPLSKRIQIEGDFDEAKRIVEVPNLADHPLVVGPRFAPWELSLSTVKPILPYRSSGLNIVLIGDANQHYRVPMRRANLVSIYEITGCFGYMTDNFFHDGKIQDKTTYKHIRSGKLDATLAKIESTQNERLFDSASVPLDSEQAYQLAKAWPSRPPKMAKWPVIFRIRCLHLKLPEFVIEVTVMNETENFLARLTHDIGTMMKSSAYTKSIRRVMMGPFSVNDSLIDKEWDIQTIVNHLNIYEKKKDELHKMLKDHLSAMPVTSSLDFATKRKLYTVKAP